MPKQGEYKEKMAGSVISIGKIVGMSILSRTSGNKLGVIEDVYFNPLEGLMLGILVKNLDGRLFAIEYKDIYSFGEDAIVAQSENVLKEIDEEWLHTQPLIKRNLSGTRIITEGGKHLGEIANVLVNLTPPPFLVYELRESFLDKLLGRGFYVLGQTGRAFSNDSERILVANETENLSAYSLEELVNQKENLLSRGERQEPQEPENFFPQDSIIVRTYGEEETVITEREEETRIPPRDI